MVGIYYGLLGLPFGKLFEDLLVRESGTANTVSETVAWYGMATGILGDLIVTSHLPATYIDIAMWIWTTSNIAWLYYGWKNRMRHMMILQIVYLCLSLWGIFQWYH